MQLIDACDSLTGWSGANGTVLSLNNTQQKEGTGCIFAAIPNLGGGIGPQGVVVTDKSLPGGVDLTLVRNVKFWFSSSKALNPGDVALFVCNGDDSVAEQIALPAIPESTWVYIVLPLNNPAADGIASYFQFRQMASSLGAFAIGLDWIAGDEDGIFMEMAFDQDVFSSSPSWTDVTKYLMKLHTHRGRTHELSKTEAGTLVLTLDNLDGSWWDLNTEGQFYPNIQPITLARLRKTYSSTQYKVFYGLVEGFHYKWATDRGGMTPIVEVDCVDMFKSFGLSFLMALNQTVGKYNQVAIVQSDAASGQNNVIIDGDSVPLIHAGQFVTVGDDAGSEVAQVNAINVSTNTLTMLNSLASTYHTSKNAYVKKFPASYSGARFQDCMLEVGWPIAMTTIATGQVVVAELVPPAGGTNCLTHLQDVTVAEDGNMFQGIDGKLVFEDSLTRQGSPYDTVQALFGDDGVALGYILPDLYNDDMYIYNGCDISGPDIAEQYYYDDYYQARQGQRTLQVTDSLIINDTDALVQCYTKVNRFKDSGLRCDSLTIWPDMDPANLYPKCLGLDISSRIEVKLNKAPNKAMLDAQYHIEAEDHDWDAQTDRWETTWQLWRVNKYQHIACLNDGYDGARNATYATAHGAASSTYKYSNNAIVAVGQQNAGAGAGNDYYIWRGMMQFNLAALTKTALAVSLLVHVIGGLVVNHQIFDLTIVDASNCHVPLIDGDWASMTGDTTPIGVVNVPIGQLNDMWLEIPLNAAGIALVNSGGMVILGLRSSLDISATPPAPGSGPEDDYVRLSGKSTTKYTPQLFIRTD